MSLKTRLDGRSTNNNYLEFRDKDGKLLSRVKSLGGSVTLEVTTCDGIFVCKNNGWKSKIRGD